MFWSGASQSGINLGYETNAEANVDSEDARERMIYELAYLHNAQYAVQISVRDCLIAGMPPEALIDMVRELCANSSEYAVLLADD